jgi:hypothetical protein
MVKGIDIFRERFRQHEGAFTLIGGAACDEWFAAQGLQFRATRDLDVVLMIEVLDRSFIAAMRSFIADGGYEIRERSEGAPVLYRFAKPAREDFPFMLELFSRNIQGLELADGQEIIPIKMHPDHHSLSAILLHEGYYELIRSHHDTRDGLQVANATALIPLKARAWLDLSRRHDAGHVVDANNITKHRNDVFRLAATLPGEAGPELPANITSDLAEFLRAFPAESGNWKDIQASLKGGPGGGFKPETLIEAIRTYFQIPAK